jgi:hypothetical protein
MSPTVFRSGPFRFFFFSPEETRRHVHVTGNAGEAKFWIQPAVELASSIGFSAKQCVSSGILSRSTWMTCKPPGIDTSDVEVTHLSPHGSWVLCNDQEYFFDYERYPWFREATVAQVHDVQATASGHFHWPQLDIDLHVDMIEQPDRFPLVSRP